MSMTWPTYDCGYQDTEGYIDPDVYRTAGELWTQAKELAASELNDEADGISLMLKAAAYVTKRRESGSEPIENLKSYLFKVYQRLLWKYRERLRLTSPLDDELIEPFVATFEGAVNDPSKSVERRILLQEICSRMDDWTLEVFQLLSVGHTFEEIALHLGTQSNQVRSKFSKRIMRLARIVETARQPRKISPAD